MNFVDKVVEPSFMSSDQIDKNLNRLLGISEVGCDESNGQATVKDSLFDQNRPSSAISTVLIKSLMKACKSDSESAMLAALYTLASGS